MGEIKEIDIKNRTYYFYNDITDLKNFDARFLKIDTKSFKGIGVYNNGYIDDCRNIHSVNLLHLLIHHAIGYIEEKGVNKYWVFNYTDENKELLKNTMMILMELEIKSKK